MDLFQYEQICSLNESEFLVYNYVSKHLREVENMNIRELSKASSVSTTTILRFCSKLGCNGYKEFKYRLHKTLEKRKNQDVYFPFVLPAIEYLQHIMDNNEFKIQMKQCADFCIQAKQVIFSGIGTSGILAKYGSRLLSDIGILSFAITNPFYSMEMDKKERNDIVFIALSVSGETPQIVSLINNFKKKQSKIISITNGNQCTIAKMSEINFCYYMPLSYVLPESNSINLTTQIPVIYLLETLRHEIYKKGNVI